MENVQGCTFLWNNLSQEFILNIRGSVGGPPTKIRRVFGTVFIIELKGDISSEFRAIVC